MTKDQAFPLKKNLKYGEHFRKQKISASSENRKVYMKVRVCELLYKPADVWVLMLRFGLIW